MFSFNDSPMLFLWMEILSVFLFFQAVQWLNVQSVWSGSISHVQRSVNQMFQKSLFARNAEMPGIQWEGQNEWEWLVLDALDKYSLGINMIQMYKCINIFCFSTKHQHYFPSIISVLQCLIIYYIFDCLVIEIVDNSTTNQEVVHKYQIPWITRYVN